MTISHSIEETQDLLQKQKIAGKTIGFVPTMGALHKGHASLIERSVKECDYTVVSIFVNPLQFGPNEDFDTYPRTLEEDAKMCREAGADLIFNPDGKKIIDKNRLAFVDIEKMQDNLCGAKRPGHFKGVCTIVAKLFNIVSPHKAFFGKKDIQQFYILKQMASDLNYPITLVPCPIIRDKDGLALSSRNKYLTEKERNEALVLNSSIKKALTEIEKGTVSAQNITALIREDIEKIESAKIDYISIVDEQMEDRETIQPGNILALAVFIGKTRLIDNHVIGEKIDW